MITTRTGGLSKLILQMVSIAISLILVMGFWAGSVSAEVQVDETMAQGIDKMLMCPVCPSETIDQSQVPLAGQMRAMVREQLRDGKTREEILKFFVDRYGLAVLAEPPRSGFNLLIWVIPPLAFISGFGLLVLVIRKMRYDSVMHNMYEVESSQSDDDLGVYLDIVDNRITQMEGSNENGTAELSNEDYGHDSSAKSCKG